MTRIKLIFRGFLLTLACTLSFSANAENSKDFGNYTVHYNAFRSDTLTPEIAKAYQLTRRNNRMVVNITVRKRDGDNGKTSAAKAKVTGFASNLTGQLKKLEFREINDGDAIYYLAQSQVSDRETLKFEIKAAPVDDTVSTTVKFKQQFFTD